MRGKRRAGALLRDAAERLAKQPCRRQRADAICVAGWHKLNNIHANDLRLPRDTFNEIDDMPIPEPAGLRQEHGRDDRWIKPIAIDRNHAARTVRHKTKGGFDARGEPSRL